MNRRCESVAGVLALLNRAGSYHGCRFRHCAGLLAGTLALVVASGAVAAPITFEFAGEVTLSAVSGLAVGAPVTGRYTFDSGATDLLPGDPTEGRYLSTNAESGWYVQFGDSVFTTQPSSSPRVMTRIFNDSLNTGTSHDGYTASGFGLAGDLGSFTIDLGNILETTTLYTSDALPLTPPTLSIAAGQLLTSSLTQVVRFSITGPLTLSSDPFPGSIPPPAPGGGTPGGGGTPPPPATIDPSACVGVTDPESRVLCLVNDVRTRGGLGGLTGNADLEQAAHVHVLDMHDNAFFGHTGSNGSNFLDRVLAAGYTGSAFGEMLGASFTDADTLVQAWLDFAGYRDLLLRGTADETGIDFFEDGTTRLWAMLVGRAPDASAPLPSTAILVVLSLAGLAWSRRNQGTQRRQAQ